MKSRPVQGRSLVAAPHGGSYLVPFVLVTSLFFLWGFAHSLLDILNKHFQEILGVTKAESGLVQTAVYGGYFIMAIPAGILMKRVGYRKGIITGLLVYAFGAFLFLPATHLQTFAPFLGALFIIALGLACLETAANPYATVLGPPERAAQRLTLSQSFNGLGWVVGPMVGSLSIFAAASGDNKFASLAVPYVGVGLVVLAVAALFWMTKLPEIAPPVTGAAGRPAAGTPAALFTHRHFVLAVIAQFFYVAAQTGINSFFINYVVDVFHENARQRVMGGAVIDAIVHAVSRANPGLLRQEALFNTTAGILLSIAGMGLFMAGRFAGSAFMTWFKPHKLLRTYAAACVVMMALVISGSGLLAIAALCATYFFMSIMFPTIFALGLVNLGDQTPRASSFIVMAIVGGAAAPPLMGWLADMSSTRTGFLVPLGCFLVVLGYSIFGYRGPDEAPRGADVHGRLGES